MLSLLIKFGPEFDGRFWPKLEIWSANRSSALSAFAALPVPKCSKFGSRALKGGVNAGLREAPEELSRPTKLCMRLMQPPLWLEAP